MTSKSKIDLQSHEFDTYLLVGFKNTGLCKVILYWLALIARYISIFSSDDFLFVFLYQVGVVIHCHLSCDLWFSVLFMRSRWGLPLVNYLSVHLSDEMVGLNVHNVLKRHNWCTCSLPVYCCKFYKFFSRKLPSCSQVVFNNIVQSFIVVGNTKWMKTSLVDHFIYSTRH